MELAIAFILGLIAARAVERYTRSAPPRSVASVVRRVVVSAAGGPGPFRPGE